MKSVFLLAVVITALPEIGSAWNSQTTHQPLTIRSIGLLSSDYTDVSVNYSTSIVSGAGNSNLALSLIVEGYAHGEDLSKNGGDAYGIWKDRVLPLYKNFSFRSAYYALGNILHLTQDQTVPPHGANVPHGPNDRFESEASDIAATVQIYGGLGTGLKNPYQYYDDALTATWKGCDNWKSIADSPFPDDISVIIPSGTLFWLKNSAPGATDPGYNNGPYYQDFFRNDIAPGSNLIQMRFAEAVTGGTNVLMAASRNLPPLIETPLAISPLQIDSANGNAIVFRIIENRTPHVQISLLADGRPIKDTLGKVWNLYEVPLGSDNELPFGQDFRVLWKGALDAGFLEGGRHKLTLIVKDMDGNSAPSTEIDIPDNSLDFDADMVAPLVIDDAFGQAHVEFRGPNPHVSTLLAEHTFEFSDEMSGLASINLTGPQMYSQSFNPPVPTTQVHLSGLPIGPYILKAIDTAGNATTVPFSVDSLDVAVSTSDSHEYIDFDMLAANYADIAVKAEASAGVKSIELVDAGDGSSIEKKILSGNAVQAVFSNVYISTFGPGDICYDCDIPMTASAGNSFLVRVTDFADNVKVDKVTLRYGLAGIRLLTNPSLLEDEHIISGASNKTTSVYDIFSDFHSIAGDLTFFPGLEALNYIIHKNDSDGYEKIKAMNHNPVVDSGWNPDPEQTYLGSVKIFIKTGDTPDLSGATEQLIENIVVTVTENSEGCPNGNYNQYSGNGSPPGSCAQSVVGPIQFPVKRYVQLLAVWNLSPGSVVQLGDFTQEFVGFNVQQTGSYIPNFYVSPGNMATLPINQYLTLTFNQVASGGNVYPYIGPGSAPLGSIALPADTIFGVTSWSEFADAQINVKYDPSKLSASQESQIKIVKVLDANSGICEELPSTVDTVNKQVSAAMTAAVGSLAAFMVVAPAYATPHLVQEGQIAGAPELEFVSNSAVSSELISDTSLFSGIMRQNLKTKHLAPVGGMYYIGPDNLELSPAGAIKMRYDKAKMSELGISEYSLGLYEFSTDGNLLFKPPRQRIDAAAGEISAEVPKLYSLFGLLVQSDAVVPQDIVYPETVPAFAGPQYSTDGILILSTAARIGLSAVEPQGDDPSITGTAYFIDESVDFNCLKTVRDLEKPAGTCANPGYTGEFSLLEGTHSIQYFSSNSAGYFESPKKRIVYIDGTSPDVEILAGTNPVSANETAYAPETSSITLTAFDPEFHGVASGVKSRHFLIDIPFTSCGQMDVVVATAPAGTCQNHIYNEPFLLQAGTHTIYYTAIDNVGNQAKVKIASITVGSFGWDKTQPLTRLFMDGVAVSSSPIGYSRPGMVLILDPSDPLVNGRASGVALTTYTLTQFISPDWVLVSSGAYPGPFVFNKEGYYKIAYSSLDKAGNTERPRSRERYIDGAVPETAAFAGGLPVGASAYITAAASIAFSGADPVSGGVSSGLATTYYLIDISSETCQGFGAGTGPSGTCQNPYYSQPFRVSPGTHTISFRSSDRAGNLEPWRSILVDYDNPLGAISLRAFGNSGSEPGRFNMPTDISIGSWAHALFVTDSGNFRVQKFTLDGKYLTQFGSMGSGPGQFGGEVQVVALSSPTLEALREDVVMVSDPANYRVQRFSANGVYMTSFGSRGSGPGQFEALSWIVGDNSGRVYVCDSVLNRVQVFMADGTLLYTLGAGELNSPKSVAVRNLPNYDSKLYVLDTGNNRIAVFHQGAFEGSLPGDFTSAVAIHADAYGRIYVADDRGWISVYAETGALLGQFGKRGTEALQFQNPRGMATDPAGYLYVADYLNDRVQKIYIPTTDNTPPSEVNLVIANVAPYYARLNFPAPGGDDGAGQAVWYDARYSETGPITTNEDFANAWPAYMPYAPQVPGVQEQLLLPGLKPGRAYHLAMRAYDAGGNYSQTPDFTITTPANIPEGGLIRYAGFPDQAAVTRNEGMPATIVQIGLVSALAVNPGGELYLSIRYVQAGPDNPREDNTIRVINPADDIITTAVGVFGLGYGGDGGPALWSMINDPRGLAANAGELIIADTANNRIRLVNAQGIINTIAGDGTTGYAGDAGPALAARLNGPRGIAPDGAGSIYFSDTGNKAIRKIDQSGKISTIIAGLENPTALKLDAGGNLLVLDGAAIKKISTSGTVLSVFALDPVAQPADIAMDPVGNIYIAEAAGHKVKKLDKAGLLTTVAGTGVAGNAVTGAGALDAQLNEPSAVAGDWSKGVLYIADAYRVSALGLAPYQADQSTTTVVGGNPEVVLASTGTYEVTQVSTARVAPALAVAALAGYEPVSNIYQLTPIVKAGELLVKFSVPASAVTDPATLAIYRFNGVSWDSSTVVNQQAVNKGDYWELSGVALYTSLFAVLHKQPDSVPPVTTLNISGYQYDYNVTLYLSTTTLLTLVSTDALSGVENVFYSTGAALIPYVGPFTLDLGAYPLSWQASDVAGNMEIPQSTNVVVITPPAFTLEFMPRTLNLSSHGNFIEAELSPYGRPVSEVALESLKITKVNGQALAKPLAPEAGARIDGNEIELKFSRQELVKVLPENVQAAITLEGKFTDNAPIEAVGYIKTIKAEHCERGKGRAQQRYQFKEKTLKEDLEIYAAEIKAEFPPEIAKKAAAAKAVGLKLQGSPWEYGPEGTVFDEPATITLDYAPEAAKPGERPAIAYWNPASNSWEPIESQADVKAKIITAEVKHFSVYQVVITTKAEAVSAFRAKAAAQPAAAGPSEEFRLGEVYVYPNPAKGPELPVFHVECGLADSVNIKVYTISGRQAHETTIAGAPAIIDDGNGASYTYEYAWRGHIPSGVYLYYIEAQKGGQKLKKTGKFAVVR